MIAISVLHAQVGRIQKEKAAMARTLLNQESSEEDRQAFIDWWDGLEAVPTINRLRRHMEEIREQELLKALSRMGSDFSDRERKVVEALTKGLVNKILHAPTTALRAAQPRLQRVSSMQALERLFSLETPSE